MKISKRLRAISDFIPDNSFILDVGCDHALLDIYLVKNKKNIKAIASDISDGPLKGAKENIKKYKTDNITIIKGDGLSTYKKGVDTVVISGLGSTTIVDILKKDIEKLFDVNRLVISSNNDYYFLRKSITKLGFFIKDEKIVYDKGKYYPIILFVKGKGHYSKKELMYGKSLMKNKDSVFFDYLVFEKEKLEKVLSSLSINHFIIKLRIKRKVKVIKKILKNISNF